MTWQVTNSESNNTIKNANVIEASYHNDNFAEVDLRAHIILLNLLSQTGVMA